MEALLRRLIAVNVAIFAVLLIGGLAAGVLAAHALSEVRELQRAVENRMQAAGEGTDVQIREFTNRRSALQPLRSGPLGQLDHQIELMKLLADEQLVLIEQFGSLRDEIRPVTSPSAPAARSSRKARSRTR